MRRGWIVAAAVAASVLGAPAWGQFAKVEDAVKYRQSALTIMGNHMGRLTAMARGDRPYDQAAVQRSAAVLKEVTALPWEAFVPGSNTAQSKFKGEIPRDAADIKELSDRMRAEVAKLASVTSQEQLRTQVGATGQACKACHDKYREK